MTVLFTFKYLHQNICISREVPGTQLSPVSLVSIVPTKEMHTFSFSELKVNNIICSSSLAGPSLQEKLSTLH